MDESVIADEVVREDMKNYTQVYVKNSFEAANPCDINIVHKMKWETMTFNVFEMRSEEAVYNAFNILSNGGVIINPIQEVPWSKCCATVIDKFGVCWWIAI